MTRKTSRTKLIAKAPSQHMVFRVWRRITHSTWYLRGAIIVMLLSTIFWATSNSLVHMENADALVDPYLFESWDTFHQARFPGAHTFLVKWPLFWLVSTLGYHTWAYVGATVTLCLITVGGLAYIMSRVERRRTVLATLLLLMSAGLMLVPAEPYAGSLLPVNMAMLASRNIEYLMLIGALFLSLTAKAWRHWRVIIAAILLTLLFASDGLFPAIAVGGGALYAVAAALRRQSIQMRQAARWVVITLLSYMTAKLLIYGIEASQLTTIVSTGDTGPYTLFSDIKAIVRGIFFVVTGLLTVLGANPMYDMRTIGQVPATALSRVWQPVTLAYVLNIAALVTVVIAQWKAKPKPTKQRQKPSIALVAVYGILVATMGVTLAAFMATDHYYPVDARYLALLPFVVFIGLALYARRLAESSTTWLIVASLSVGSLLAAIPGVVSQYVVNRLETKAQIDRNKYIADALKSAPVDVLVGDYWRVLPIKHNNPLTEVIPTENCLNTRSVLTSGAWEIDLSSAHFAFLLTLESTSPAVPNCSYGDVIGKYGKPNSQIVVDGTQEHPKELLLFFENDRNTQEAVVNDSVPMLLPKALQAIMDLPKGCRGKTTVSIMAHEDDDLLFMNPALMNTPMSDGISCVRAIYITAGDAGHPGKRSPYWIGRERGAQSAYATMFGFNDSWTAEPLHMGGGATVNYASPRDVRFEQRISLVFFRLPDGSFNGDGFQGSAHASLAKLVQNATSSITSVDGEASYTHSSLVSTLARLLAIFQPDLINAQSADSTAMPPDHSDHAQAARLAKDARALYELQGSSVPVGEHKVSQIVHYSGYSIQSLPANVAGDELARKERIFMAYAQHDKAVCQTVRECYDARHVYGKYLTRQYRQ